MANVIPPALSEMWENVLETQLNHLVKQVTGFRIGDKATGKLDLLDCFAYSVIITRNKLWPR